MKVFVNPIVAFAMGLCLASCSNDNDEKLVQSTGTVDMTFTGYADLGERTVLDTDGKKVLFATNDEISVLSSTNNHKFTTTENGESATFKGKAEESVTGFYILYPYQEGASRGTFRTTDGQDVQGILAEIPTVQTATADTFDPKANVSVAVPAQNNTFKLLNACNLVKFQTTQECSRVIIDDVDGRPMAGKVVIDPATGVAKPATVGADRSVTLEGVQANTVYYIAVLPGVTKLKLTFLTSDSKCYVKAKSSAVTLQRNHVSNVGTITPSEAELLEGYVDLGLPSGTLWATRNIGATNETDNGNFYAWGETTTKTEFTWATYFDGDGSGDPSKFTNYTPDQCLDGKTTLLPLHDAATQNLGKAWRMPTMAEQQELLSECTITVSCLEDLTPILTFTGKNGNSIKIPVPGLMTNEGILNEKLGALYWSSTFMEGGTVGETGQGAVCLTAYVNIWGPTWSAEIAKGYFRYYGGNIRPVVNI